MSEERQGPEFDLFGFERVNDGIETRWDAGGQRQTQHPLVRVDQPHVEAYHENGQHRNIKHRDEYEVLDTRGQRLHATAHRLHPEHGDQDAAVRQHDEDEGTDNDGHAEDGRQGPVQRVVVARQPEHGRVVTEVAEHLDRVAKRQSPHDQGGEKHDRYRVRPRDRHDARHAAQRVDRVLTQREAYRD